MLRIVHGTIVSWSHVWNVDRIIYRLPWEQYGDVETMRRRLVGSQGFFRNPLDTVGLNLPYTPIDRQDRITHVPVYNMYLLYTITYPDDATNRTWYDRLMVSYIKRWPFRLLREQYGNVVETMRRGFGKSGIFHKSPQHCWTQIIHVPFTTIDQDRVTYVDSYIYLIH